MFASTALAALALTGVVHASVSPSVAHRDGAVYVAVSGLSGPAADVRIEGGVASMGKWFGWVKLRDTGNGTWRAHLVAPGFFGVYPLQVRVGRQVIDTGEQIRILPPGYAARPGFFDPTEVARWWVGTARQQTTLEAVGTWSSGYFTHRDPAFNRLLRLRVRVDGRFTQRIFLSIARLRTDGPWRLLETALAP